MKYKLLILFFVACVFGCKHSKYDSEAIRLNNEAVVMVFDFDPNTQNLKLKKAIELENQAIKIDSNYPIAYWSKLSFLKQLKDYRGIAEIAKQSARFFPDDSQIKIGFGIACEKIGDTIMARKYFNESLLLLDKTLDTMSVNSKEYKSFIREKAANLVYLHQEQKANKIIEELDNKETDVEYKHVYKQFVKTSRSELLNNEGRIEANWEENGVTRGLSINF